jgi:hypothetical protein
MITVGPVERGRGLYANTVGALKCHRVCVEGIAFARSKAQKGKLSRTGHVCLE